MEKAWEDISLLQEEEPISVRLDPEEKKPTLLTKVLSAGESTVSKVLSSGESRGSRAAFVHDAEPETSAWTRGHEQGRQYAERMLEGTVRTTAYFNALASDPYAVLEQAVADGNTTVFTTSPRLLPAALRAAVEHPEVTVFNCSLNQSHRYIRTYYARMYEAKFVIGAIAGAMAEHDEVGYICDYPIFGQIAGINAFALGVQMVNPRAKVLLEWSSVGGGEAALARLRDRGVQLISFQDMVRRGEEQPLRGLCELTDKGIVRLATPLWQWGKYYEEILRRIKSRTEKETYTGSSKAMNYFWGMSAGVIGINFYDRLPPSTKKLAVFLQESIRSGVCNPFRGPLYTQDGTILENDSLLTPEQIITMEELMDNVIGRIPRYEELTDTGRATVDVVGVAPATKEKRG